MGVLWESQQTSFLYFRISAESVAVRKKYHRKSGRALKRRVLFSLASVDHVPQFLDVLTGSMDMASVTRDNFNEAEQLISDDI